MGSWPFIRLKEIRELILPQEVQHTEEEKKQAAGVHLYM